MRKLPIALFLICASALAFAESSPSVIQTIDAYCVQARTGGLLISFAGLGVSALLSISCASLFSLGTLFGESKPGEKPKGLMSMLTSLGKLGMLLGALVFIISALLLIFGIFGHDLLSAASEQISKNSAEALRC
ncbi:MAG: hypothetical protein ABIH99_02230 [Candidatus Micrarchaeota archaeon]